MSVQRPNLWRVLSDTLRIISSNSRHFAAISVLFIFPITLFNIIYSLLLHPSPLSHYRRLLSTVSNQDSEYSSEKSPLLPQLFYGLLVLVFNLFAVSSVSHSTFHGFHSKPLKLAASLKSILSSFLPLLATKLVYLIIYVAISLGFGICTGFVFLGLFFLGLEIEPSSKSFMAVVFVMVILFLVLFFYFAVKWCLAYAIVVVESKYGYAPFQRSSDLVKGAKLVALLMILLFAIPQMILSAWFLALAGGARTSNACVVLQFVAYAAFSTVLSLIALAANTVLFVHCKAFNEKSEELEFPSDVKNKLGQVYVQLPNDVVDHV